MDLFLKQFKFLVTFIILCTIFPEVTSVIPFTFPQSTTLSNGNILVVERDGIYVCDPNLSNILRTLHTFPDEDKISSQLKLSKTIIKKTSIVIIIFSNYKRYLIDSTTGILTYKDTSQIITGEDPEYVTVTYYTNAPLIKFIIGYINSNNELIIYFYESTNSHDSITLIDSYSLSSVTRPFSPTDSGTVTFYFQNKGLNCDYMKDISYTSRAFFSCFLVGQLNSIDYLIPVILYDDNDSLRIISSSYKFDKIKLNYDNKQIKSDTNGDMTISDVCYVTEEKIGRCTKFILDLDYYGSNYDYGFAYFDSKIYFSKNCRSDIYGMKVTYIFEQDKVLFSCSDEDGSIQVYIFDDSKKYVKFSNCNSIYGYSIIYLESLADYYVTSDVICPDGKIPFDILIETSGYTPEYVEIIEKTSFITSKMGSTIITDKAFESTYYENIIKESTNKVTEKITEQITEKITEKITEQITEKMTEKMTEKVPESTLVTEKMSTTINNQITTNEIITEKLKTTEVINNHLTEITEKVNSNECPQKCLECNSQKKCTKCNKSNNYYPIELTSTTSGENHVQSEIECITEEEKQIKHPNFYKDPESESFKPCYENCATCFGKGDGNNNNCITCEPGYTLHPEYENSKDCVPKPNSLYYMKYDQYTITNSDKCPEDFNLLIKEKSKCIEDCKLDNKYKYTYDDLCYEHPPENTNDEDGDYKCKDNPNTCIATRKELYTLNDTITDLEIEVLILKYAQEYDYTNYHITIYENDIYIITIYKNGECLSELGILTKMIDFGDCYNEIHSKNSIPQNKNLIVAQIETKPGKESYKRNPSYGLYHPDGGHSLNFESECREQKVTIQTNLTEQFNNSKVSFDNIKLMADSGLDLFDPTCPFYNDLCTHYPDILGKDIPLEKRILAYYPDIELCEDNCDLAFVFLNNKTAKCECPISGEGGKLDKLKENSLYKNELGYFEELFYSTNINVIKCYKDLFKQEYFVKCYGGFIILGLIFIQIMCTLIYCTKSRFHLKKYFFNITNKYLNYLKNKNPMKNIGQKPQMIKGGDIGKISKICIPPRKSVKAPSGVDIFVKKQNKPNNINQKNQKGIIPFDNSTEKITMNNSTNQRRKPKLNTFKKRQTNFGINHKISGEQSDSDNLMNNISDELDIKIEEFLKTDLEDMDYDDAIRRDKRTFCVYYGEKIQSEQMILNTFCHKEYLKPMPIKIILLVLQVELYFFINGLFYNEEYVTKIFELEKDTFGNKTWRFLDNLFYAFIVGVIINYVIEFFFIQEKKIRVTLKREKNNLLILKYEMVQIIKDLQKRFLSFIIVSFIVSVFIWYHISCFNNVYKHMKDEWLVFSILIIVCIQLLSLVTCLIETILRFLSFRFKSEKLFKLSLIFS